MRHPDYTTILAAREFFNTLITIPLPARERDAKPDLDNSRFFQSGEVGIGKTKKRTKDLGIVLTKQRSGLYLDW